MGKPKVWCRQRETRACSDSFDCSVLVVTNFSIFWLQLFFCDNVNNVVTLHLYIIAITTFRVPRGAFNDGSHFKEKGLSLSSFM